MIREKFWILYNLTDSEAFNKRYADKKLAELESKITAIATHSTIVVLESVIGYDVDINKVEFEIFDWFSF